MHVIADPADGILRRGPFAEDRMDMAVNNARQHGVAFGIDGPVGLNIAGGVYLGDAVAVDEERPCIANRVGKIAGEEFADIGDQCPRHGSAPVVLLSHSLR
jgi:hypothetical protein